MNWVEPTDELRAEYAAWVAERPDHVRVIAEKFFPWTMYRLATTGQRCRFIGLNEGDQICGGPAPDPNKVTLRVIAEHPWEAMAELTRREVFGIAPHKLREWVDSDEEDWPDVQRIMRAGIVVGDRKLTN